MLAPRLLRAWGPSGRPVRDGGAGKRIGCPPACPPLPGMAAPQCLWPPSAPRHALLSIKDRQTDRQADRQTDRQAGGPPLASTEPPPRPPLLSEGPSRATERATDHPPRPETKERGAAAPVLSRPPRDASKRGGVLMDPKPPSGSRALCPTALPRPPSPGPRHSPSGRLTRGLSARAGDGDSGDIGASSASSGSSAHSGRLARPIAARGSGTAAGGGVLGLGLRLLHSSLRLQPRPAPRGQGGRLKGGRGNRVTWAAAAPARSQLPPPGQRRTQAPSGRCRPRPKEEVGRPALPPQPAAGPAPSLSPSSFLGAGIRGEPLGARLPEVPAWGIGSRQAAAARGRGRKLSPRSAPHLPDPPPSAPREGTLPADRDPPSTSPFRSCVLVPCSWHPLVCDQKDSAEPGQSLGSERLIKSPGRCTAGLGWHRAWDSVHAKANTRSPGGGAKLAQVG
jgi:hypothetical protein